MKKYILFSLLCINGSAFCQARVDGAYFFRRQEMVAAFNFSEGNKFEFFYSYGAVDRSATGTFSIVGDTIKLKSDKKPGNDFTVTKQSRQGTGYTLRFEDPNKYLLQNITCVFIIAGKEKTLRTDSKGTVKLDVARCEKIFVQHELYPDVSTMIKDKANNNNSFTIKLNPSLAQVSFKALDLIITRDTLKLPPNYLMPMSGIAFTKE